MGGKGGIELGILLSNIQRWEYLLKERAINHIELAELILDERGYTGMWQNDKTPDAPGRLENLKELVKALENFENIQDSGQFS